MRLALLIGCLCFLSLVLQGCEERPIRRGSGGAAFLEFDSELDSDETLKVQESSDYLTEREIRGSRVRWFREIFGGEDSAAFHPFLSERVRFILSKKTDIQSRIRVNAQTLNFEPAEEDAGRGATNLAALWYLQKSVDPGRIQFEINDRWISIDSTRVGIVQLGPAFVRVSRMIRAGVLLHEARHSDCTGGIWRSDILRTAEGLDPVGVSCGHLHVLCPEGHEFQGLYACDQEAWGAYSVNLIYFRSLQYGCSDCSEEESVMAEAAAADAASRLLFPVSRMLQGDYGSPDMSSSTEVVAR